MATLDEEKKEPGQEQAQKPSKFPDTRGGSKLASPNASSNPWYIPAIPGADESTFLNGSAIQKNDKIGYSVIEDKYAEDERDKLKALVTLNPPSRYAGRGGIIFTIRGIGGKIYLPTTSTQKLALFVLAKAREGVSVIELEVKGYAELLGKDVNNPVVLKELRAKLIEDANILTGISIDVSQLAKRPRYVWTSVVVTDVLKDRKGWIKIFLNERAVAFLSDKSKPWRKINPKVFLLDGRDKNALSLYLYLCRHYQIENNVKNGTNNIIKIRSLIESPLLNFLTYDQVSESNRNYTDRVETPILAGLKTLKEARLIKWKPCKSKKEPLKEGELAEYRGSKKFQDLYINFEMIFGNDFIIE